MSAMQSDGRRDPNANGRPLNVNQMGTSKFNAAMPEMLQSFEKILTRVRLEQYILKANPADKADEAKRIAQFIRSLFKKADQSGSSKLNSAKLGKALVTPLEKPRSTGLTLEQTQAFEITPEELEDFVNFFKTDTYAELYSDNGLALDAEEIRNALALLEE